MSRVMTSDRLALPHGATLRTVTLYVDGAGPLEIDVVTVDLATGAQHCLDGDVISNQGSMVTLGIEGGHEVDNNREALVIRVGSPDATKCSYGLTYAIPEVGWDGRTTYREIAR